jgi:hypothetical protein
VTLQQPAGGAVQQAGWRGSAMLLLALLWTVANALLLGWVITQAWGWFAVPLRLPPVHLFHGLGLRLLALLLLTRLTWPGRNPPPIGELARGTVLLVAAWGLAFLLHVLARSYPW